MKPPYGGDLCHSPSQRLFVGNTDEWLETELSVSNCKHRRRKERAIGAWVLLVQFELINSLYGGEWKNVTNVIASCREVSAV